MSSWRLLDLCELHEGIQLDLSERRAGEGDSLSAALMDEQANQRSHEVVTACNQIN
jgi:hypothetical protein